MTGCISCSSIIYMPNQVNAPLLQEKHELKVNAAPSNLQAAYAVTDKFAVMVNGQYSWEVFGRNTASSRGSFTMPKGGVIEAGAGIFKKITDSRKPPIVLDLFAGYGIGGFQTMSRSYYLDSTNPERKAYTVRTRFHKFFIQPGIGMVHKNVEIAFTTRFTFLSYRHPVLGSMVYQNEAYDRSDLMKAASTSHFLYEPAITLRLGRPRFKWHLQVFTCTPNIFDVEYYFPPININTGITFTFSAR